MKRNETHQVADVSKPPQKGKGAFDQVFDENEKRVRGFWIRNGAYHAQVRFSPTHINRLQLQNTKIIPQPGAIRQELMRKLRGNPQGFAGRTTHQLLDFPSGRWQISHPGRKHWASEIFPGILDGMIRWLTLVLHLAVAGLKSRPRLRFHSGPVRRTRGDLIDCFRKHKARSIPRILCVPRGALMFQEASGARCLWAKTPGR